MGSKKVVALAKMVGELRKAARALTLGVAENRKMFHGLAGDVRNAFANDNTIIEAHDGLADRYYGLVDLLRKNPDLLPLISDEDIMVAAQNRRQMRIVKEREATKALEEAEKVKADQDELEGLAAADKRDPSGQQESGVPKGATVFGGTS